MIITIVGARPQFIKAATVSRALSAAGISESIVHTGQHHDSGMSEVFFEELDLPRPTHNLGIAGRGHGAMTGAMLEALEPLLETERPSWVLVYGDTNSTLAGALAASKLNIPVAHVEAGLRSFNRRMPEEQNRVVTDHLADILFTPTNLASNNLRNEGIPAERIHQVGDVMYDAALYYAERAAARSSVVDQLVLTPGGYVLATIHRAENTDDPQRLRSIIAGLERVARDTLPVVMPLHPRTRAGLERDGVEPTAIRLIEPVGYLDMVALERNAAVIATDSGGVQKEAYFFSVPCVTLRDETEWLELVESGWNRIASPARSDVAEEVQKAIGTRGERVNPYGSGHAASAIGKVLLHVN